ncbi:MAG: sporulation initiation factor Spo0A C-terminal domain-containing protein [Clostridia bacterium]
MTKVEVVEQLMQMQRKIADLIVLLEDEKEEFSKPVNPKVELKKVVTNELSKLGYPMNIQGFAYVRTAILMVMENPEMIQSITKQLYPSVACQYHTTSSKVERSIRHGIERTFDKGNMEQLNRIFGYVCSMDKGKTTNSEFIATLAERIRLQLN